MPKLGAKQKPFLNIVGDVTGKTCIIVEGLNLLAIFGFRVFFFNFWIFWKHFLEPFFSKKLLSVFHFLFV